MRVLNLGAGEAADLVIVEHICVCHIDHSAAAASNVGYDPSAPIGDRGALGRGGQP